MQQIGTTTDGKMVMDCVARLYFEQGLPPGIVFDELSKRNAMPSWPHLYNDLAANGMSHKRIIHLLYEHMFDTYGKEFRDEVIRRLDVLRQ